VEWSRITNDDPMALSKSIAPPNTAFQSDPRLVALYKIGRILAVGFDLSKAISARAAERQAVGLFDPLSFSKVILSARLLLSVLESESGMDYYDPIHRIQSEIDLPTAARLVELCLHYFTVTTAAEFDTMIVQTEALMLERLEPNDPLQLLLESILDRTQQLACLVQGIADWTTTHAPSARVIEVLLLINAPWQFLHSIPHYKQAPRCSLYRRCLMLLSRRLASWRQAASTHTRKSSWRRADAGGAGWAQTRQIPASSQCSTMIPSGARLGCSGFGGRFS
jgi:hypothetical protein